MSLSACLFKILFAALPQHQKQESVIPGGPFLAASRAPVSSGSCASACHFPCCLPASISSSPSPLSLPSQPFFSPPINTLQAAIQRPNTVYTFSLSQIHQVSSPLPSSPPLHPAGSFLSHLHQAAAFSQLLSAPMFCILASVKTLQSVPVLGAGANPLPALQRPFLAGFLPSQAGGKAPRVPGTGPG